MDFEMQAKRYKEETAQLQQKLNVLEEVSKKNEEDLKSKIKSQDNFIVELQAKLALTLQLATKRGSLIARIQKALTAGADLADK